ncbi:holo-ACP synthase [Olsenella sp. Marseille-P4559]|jgi:holo-[acyl-carrier protein] synthase|uniref:holo-ACP synthase n=1 Tax=Olsenella sp. Marseille-P4559 TaxID=2364795 RepID=UPI00102FAA33|nr:holo-ACP synthase [Olsenella sp. Marseille-P4559]
MALAGIGVDMLEIARMERTMHRRPSFLARVFTEEERAYCDACARPAEHYAARFAAREAVVKALGTGFSNGVGFSDVSVTMDAHGRPHALLTGRAAQTARESGVREVALSLSYTREVAVANAVAVTDEVRPQPDTRPDPERELAASFREARSVLDELEQAQDGIMADVSGERSVTDTQITQEDGNAGGAADASAPAEPAKE